MNVIKAERLSARAQKLLARNQPANAVLLLEKAAQLCPDDPRILIPYSQALAREGRIEESEKQLLHAESAAPKNPSIRLFLGILYYDQKRFQDALDSFETCLKKQPSNQLARNFRALTLFALGRKMEAIQSLKNEHLEHHIPLLSRLCALLELEIHKSASMPGERESDLFSENPESPAQPSSPGDQKPPGYFAAKKMMRTAISALNNRDYDTSLRLFHALWSRDPDNPTATFGMVISLTEKNLYERAQNILIDYLDRKKGRPESALVAWLGRIYILLGSYERGILLLKSLSVEGPVDYNINYYLALGYLFQGNAFLAFHYFDRAFRYYYVDTLEDCLLPLVQKAGDHITSS